jgi:ligand-binding sensor domain-containing protein
MRLIVLFLLINIALLLDAQSCLTQIGESDIQCISEDEQFIWLGTNQGLQRYDKLSEALTIWSSQNSALDEDLVISVQAYQGDILLSTESSLYKLDLFLDQIIPLNDSLSGQLAEGNQGQLILAGGEYYYEFVESEVSYYQDLGELVTLSCPICDNSTDIEVMENGELWISHFGFYEFDLLHFDGESWTIYDSQSHPEVFPIESWSDNKLDSKNNVLLSTSWGGLLSHQNQEWAILDGYSNPQVIVGEDTLLLGHTGVTYDQSNGFWFGTNYDYLEEGPAKLAYFNESDWQIIPLPGVIPYSVVDMLASNFDSNLIYIGTSEGFFILDKSCLGIVSGLSEINKIGVSIYPNPTREYLRFSQAITGDITLTNALGQHVFTAEMKNTEHLQLPNLTLGAYIISVDNNGQRFQLPIVIE